MLIMYGAGAYKRLWRYFNEKDYLVCGLAMFAGFALGYLIMSILQIQQSVLFVALYAILATGGVLLFRFIFKRTFLNLIEVGRADNCERTLIVGAGNAGRSGNDRADTLDESNPFKANKQHGFPGYRKRRGL